MWICRLVLGCQRRWTGCAGLVCTRTWSFGRVRQVGRTTTATDTLTHAVQILQVCFTFLMDCLLNFSRWVKSSSLWSFGHVRQARRTTALALQTLSLTLSKCCKLFLSSFPNPKIFSFEYNFYMSIKH